jgi:hypothetical protein
MGAMAEAFTAFAQPLLKQTDGSQEQLERALAISSLCYNLALAPEDSRNEMLGDIRSTLAMDDEEFDDFQRSIVVPMIRRHEAMFPLMHRRVPADLLQTDPSPRAQTRSAAHAETHPVIDRYAPCPCNSGEKYKFCCGRKSR